MPRKERAASRGHTWDVWPCCESPVHESRWYGGRPKRETMCSGCLHGDVKPSNIGFTAEGAPKLLDFGLAHAVDDAALVGGTLPYLSPEVLTGRPAEAADDVWSLSVVLYEMVAGRQPFAGGTIEEVQRRIRRQRLAAGGPDAAAAPTAATAVAVFAAAILTAPRAGRPDTAPAFAAALAEVPGTA